MKHLFVALAILISTPFAFADTTPTVTTQWFDEESSEFGTDTYEEDGCFC
jgi:hypothetical protein